MSDIEAAHLVAAEIGVEITPKAEIDWNGIDRGKWIDRCPLCNHRLQMRAGGWACKNWKCKMYWKMDIGPVWRSPKMGWQIRVWKPYIVPDRDE